jgi:CheY-like chemotaxis protein
MIKPTILVVDDEKKFTDYFIKFLLDNFNAEVILKDNVRDAIEVIDKQRIDILFQDIHFPNGAYGFEVIRHLKKDGKDKNTSIFIITKWIGDESYAKQIKELGVRYIPKPISLISTKDILEDEFEKSGKFDYKKK